MIGITGAPLPLLALIWPLALACVVALPPVRVRASQLLPFAPLPALWLGLSGPTDITTAPFLLLGVNLVVTQMGALFILMTAGIWLGAGIYAQGYMTSSDRPAVFTGFWCLTLSGNLGVFLAADVVTFYVAFAIVSFAAYVLIVHDATRAALRAGRVYIVLVICGEVCLLVAFVIGIDVADSVSIEEIRLALASAPQGSVAALLLIAGFGIKAGLMPLHFWLPLAHPAAPTPASAVLSGAIVKAGIIGLILFLPAGIGFLDGLVIVGFAGAFGAAILGLLRIEPKAILAYSTISQMSLVIGLIAASAASGDQAGFDQIAYYAFHHGLAKGALFLAVGLVVACRGGWRRAMLLATAFVALSVCGASLTGGNLVKLAVKSGLEGAAEMALTLTAITTTLVLGWFMWRLAHTDPGKGRPSVFLAVPTLALGLSALIIPWLLRRNWSGLDANYPLQLTSIWESSWPVVVGAMAAVVWLRHAQKIKSLITNSINKTNTSGLRIARSRSLQELRPVKASMTALNTVRSAVGECAHAVINATARLPALIETCLNSQRSMGLLLILLAATIAFQIWN
ncbi:complex I subunit 5 family protein [Loktanella sp. SALINAS62]|uniref:complex I subunit 5 family protein n=1 Tax=Loktanella sp. SALINAS62 TaxID=2706124 RepID=UPI001B8C487B|nr:complex I subunit 5 family protein [Loktanella sp. SALINAS62]MBS1304115.1 NADH dehydrogenase [Loktanella sp. SALINAS62]